MKSGCATRALWTSSRAQPATALGPDWCAMLTALLQPATWDDALSLVAGHLKAADERVLGLVGDRAGE